MTKDQRQFTDHLNRQLLLANPAERQALVNSLKRAIWFSTRLEQCRLEDPSDSRTPR